MRGVLPLLYAGLLSVVSASQSYSLRTPSAGASDPPSANSSPTRQSEPVPDGTGVGGKGSAKGQRE